MSFFNLSETDRSLSLSASMFRKHLVRTFKTPLKWPLCDENPDDWRRIQFNSESQSILTALSAPALGEPRGTVVCAHPFDKSAKCYFLQNGYSRQLRANGYNLLLFDFNGFGESSSGNFDFSADVLAAGYAASVLFDSDRLGFWGIDFGASWGISALRLDHMFKVGIFESPFPDFRRYLKHHPGLEKKTRLLSRFAPPTSPIVDFFHARNIEKLLFLFDEENSAIPADTRKRFTEVCQSNWPPESKQLPWLEWPSATYDLKLISKNDAYPDHVLGCLDSYFIASDKKPNHEMSPEVNGSQPMSTRRKELLQKNRS